MNAIVEIMRFQSDRLLNTQTYDWTNEAKNILEEVCEADGLDIPKELRTTILEPAIQNMRALVSDFAEPARPVTNEEIVDAYGDIIVFAIGAIMKLGYSPEGVLDEVAKEINSRKGEIINGKFEKFTDKKHTQQWYKADFSKHRV